MFQFKPLLSSQDRVLLESASSKTNGLSGSFACVIFDTGDQIKTDHLVWSLDKETILGPKAKRGEDTCLVAQLDFKEIKGVEGTLNLYLSPQYKNYQPKERGWGFVSLNEKGSCDLSLSKNYIFMQSKLALELKTRQACDIAAFHANGISYSPARANDPHYGHLLQSAQNWFVLFAIREKYVLNQETSCILYVCMTEDDFNNKAFGKCQLVFV